MEEAARIGLNEGEAALDVQEQILAEMKEQTRWLAEIARLLGNRR